MEQRTDAQRFDELANEIETSIKNGELNPCNVDPELVSSCLTRINTIRRGKVSAKLGSTPCHLTEIDKAICSGFSIEYPWDAETRKAHFDGHIATIDLLSQSEDCTDKASALTDTAIFVRAIIIGLEQYKMKMSRMQPR